MTPQILFMYILMIGFGVATWGVLTALGWIVYLWIVGVLKDG